MLRNVVATCDNVGTQTGNRLTLTFASLLVCSVDKRFNFSTKKGKNSHARGECSEYVDLLEIEARSALGRCHSTHYALVDAPFLGSLSLECIPYFSDVCSYFRQSRMLLISQNNLFCLGIVPSIKIR